MRICYAGSSLTSSVIFLTNDQNCCAMHTSVIVVHITKATLSLYSTDFFMIKDLASKNDPWNLNICETSTIANVYQVLSPRVNTLPPPAPLLPDISGCLKASNVNHKGNVAGNATLSKVYHV